MSIADILHFSDEDFVKHLYEIFLGREPDPSGLKKYVQDLNLGKTRFSVLSDIGLSDESIEKGLYAKLPAEDASMLSLAKKIHSIEKQNIADRLLQYRSKRESELFSGIIFDLISALRGIKEVGLDTKEDKLLFSVRVTGGLGDAVIISRFVRDFQNYVGRNTVFDVYFHSPSAVEIFFKQIPGFRASISDEFYNEAVECYDFSLVTNQFLWFVHENINRKRILKLAPKVLNVLSSVEKKRKPIEKYICNHPNFDGAFADLAVKSGHKRYTYLHYMAGILYGGDRLDLSHLTKAVPNKPIGPYVTIHDGWDTKFDFKEPVDRPTKTLPLETWKQFILLFKKQFSGVKIVQIGAETGSDLPGVDVSFKGKLSLDNSLAILSSALLHIDTESGLVHIAASLGVKSLVFFGPTNLQWFSYEQNVNIPPTKCGNCWWSTETWMEQCPAEYEAPVCMQSHSHEDAISAIDALVPSLF